MSLRSTARALPTLLRVGVAEAVAYRAELFVWVLATTMPFVNLALWSAVARDAPITSGSGRTYGQGAITAYFLTTFIVRQLNSSWAAWQMNFEVRQGTLSMRLLRPLSPIVAYAAENVAALPMRVIVTLPVAVLLLLVVGTHALPTTLVDWAIVVAAMLGGWLITFLINVAIGTLSLFMQQSLKVMEVYLAVYFVMSGYLFPVDFFPPVMKRVADALPFRFQIGFPVELLNSMHTRAEALGLLATEWVYVLGLLGLVTVLWRTGLKRFGAYGG